MALFNAADFGGGWLPFEDRWNETPIQDGTFAAPGDSRYAGMPDMVNARLFPGYGTNMPQGGGEAAGGPQMPVGAPQAAPQGMPPMSLLPQPAPPVMPSLGGMAPVGRPPDIGDRIQAAGAGFFNAGSPMQAIGNLIGGAITGQRQDPVGIAAQVYGQQQAIAQQSQAAAMEYVLQDSSIPQPMKLAMLRQPALAMKYVAELAKPPKYEFQKLDPGQTAGFYAPPQGGFGPAASIVQQGGTKPGDVTELRKEISNLPEVKRYSEANPVFRSMLQTHQKAINNVGASAVDIDFVYGLAKIFDPDSVVREGEMLLVKKLQSLPEEVRGYIQKVNSGNGLTAEVRQRILEVARTRMGELKGSLDERLTPYGGIAERGKINTKDVMPQFPDLPNVPMTAEVMAEAKAALKQGKPRDAIINRLLELGYDPKGL